MTKKNKVKWKDLPVDLRRIFVKYLEVLIDYSEFDGDRRGIADALDRVRRAMSEKELTECANVAIRKLGKGLL